MHRKQSIRWSISKLVTKNKVPCKQHYTLFVFVFHLFHTSIIKDDHLLTSTFAQSLSGMFHEAAVTAARAELNYKLGIFSSGSNIPACGLSDLGQCSHQSKKLFMYCHFRQCRYLKNPRRVDLILFKKFI